MTHRYVEGRLTFSMRWHPAQETVAVATARLLEVLQGAGCDVRALEASLVTADVEVKEDGDSAADKQP